MATKLKDISFDRMDGHRGSLSDYAGRVLLVVNVASKCGLTPQYRELEAIYRKYQGRGLVVLGFPANDFLDQEPGTNEEIATFCKSTYEVDFPLFSKISVTGPGQHPLYKALTAAEPVSQGQPDEFRSHLTSLGIATSTAPEVLWNFEKFLVGRDGSVVGRFAPSITPDDPLLTAAIERALDNAA